RYWLLETIREFAANRLIEAGELDELRCRHREYYATQAEVFTDYSHLGDGSARDVFKADRANYRVALQDAVSTESTELALALVASLRQVWSDTGQIADGYSLARAAL